MFFVKDVFALFCDDLVPFGVPGPIRASPDGNIHVYIIIILLHP